MHRLGYLDGDNWAEYSPEPVYWIDSPAGQQSRIIAGISAADFAIFERLVLLLKPPYFLLYVLHTPRGEAEAGRYQSPALIPEQISGFLTQFKDLLTSDGRFDLWAHSPNENATIIWDRHNQIFAYGPISRFETELRAQRFQVGTPIIPSPHEHCYRDEFDQDARSVLQAFEWSYSPLHPEDEQ